MTQLLQYKAGTIYEVEKAPNPDLAEIGAIFKIGENPPQYIIVIPDVGGLPKGYINWDPPTIYWVAGELFQAPSTTMAAESVDFSQLTTWEATNTLEPTTQVNDFGVYILSEIIDSELRGILQDLNYTQNTSALKIKNFAGKEGLELVIALNTATTPQTENNFVSIVDNKIKLGFVRGASCEFILLFNKPVGISKFVLEVPVFNASRGDVVYRISVFSYVDFYNSTPVGGGTFNAGDYGQLLQDSPPFLAGSYQYDGSVWNRLTDEEERQLLQRLATFYPVQAEFTTLRSVNPTYQVPEFVGLTPETTNSFQFETGPYGEKVLRGKIEDTDQFGAPRIRSYPLIGDWQFGIPSPCLGIKVTADYADIEIQDSINPDFVHALYLKDFEIKTESGGEIYQVRNTNLGWEGEELSSGDIVPLTDQSRTAGWVHLEVAGRSVINMNLPPVRTDDTTKGFRARTSFWSTLNRVTYRCVDATRDQAEWEIVATDAIKTPPSELSFFVESLGEIGERNQGLYLFKSLTGASSASGLKVTEAETFIGNLDPEVDRGFATGRVTVTAGNVEDLFFGLKRWIRGNIRFASGGHPALAGAGADPLLFQTQAGGTDADGGSVFFALGVGSGQQGKSGSFIVQTAPGALGDPNLGDIIFRFGQQAYSFPKVAPVAGQALVFDSILPRLTVDDANFNNIALLRWGAVDSVVRVPTSYTGLVGDDSVPNAVVLLQEVLDLDPGESTQTRYLVEIDGAWRVAPVTRLPSRQVVWGGTAPSIPTVVHETSGAKTYIIFPDGSRTEIGASTGGASSVVRWVSGEQTIQAGDRVAILRGTEPPRLKTITNLTVASGADDGLEILIFDPANTFAELPYGFLTATDGETFVLGETNIGNSLQLKSVADDGTTRIWEDLHLRLIRRVSDNTWVIQIERDVVSQISATAFVDTVAEALDTSVTDAAIAPNTLTPAVESILQARITQPQLITYNDPALISQVLGYSQTYYVDLRGTTEANRLTLQLPGAESTTEMMEIIIRDLPQETFNSGYLRIEALPDGATPIQILTPEGLTDTSEAGVSAFSLKGSEIYLARTVGSDRWLMSLRLPGAGSEIWTGTLAEPPNPALHRLWVPRDADPGVVKFFSPATQTWEDIA